MKINGHNHLLSKIIKILFFSAIISFPIFLNLETLPIRLWDESRLAINAYEMYENNNYLIPYFQGQPDMWNTKPPLMIWSQVFFFKVVSPGELAVRLPAGIASFLTCIMIFLKRLRSSVPQEGCGQKL